MGAIDYQTTVNALDAALATAVGADATLGAQLRANIASKGERLTSRFTPAIDAAKTTWASEVSSAFTQAQEAAGFVYNQAGEPAPPVLTVNYYDPAQLNERLSDAGQFATSTFLRNALSAHLAAFGVAFNVGGPNASPYTQAPSTWDAKSRKSKQSDISVAQLEREIYRLIQDATQWLALAAF